MHMSESSSKFLENRFSQILFGLIFIYLNENKKDYIT